MIVQPAPKQPALLLHDVPLRSKGYICFMQVDDALVQKLATLAHLRFTDEEQEAIKSDLQKMIGFIDKLQELDTTGVAPLMHMSDAVNVLRDDVPGAMLPTEQALHNAPHHDGHYFQVPKVIKK